jgi:hypothetical protein
MRILQTTVKRLQDGWYTIHGKNCGDMMSATLTNEEASWCNLRRRADEWPLIFHTWIPAVTTSWARRRASARQARPTRCWRRSTVAS